VDKSISVLGLNDHRTLPLLLSCPSTMEELILKIVTEIPESVSLDDALLNSPGHLEGAFEATGSPLCSYLIGLAAFQRGLTVTYHRAAMDKGQFDTARLDPKDQNGIYYTISDGKHTHRFDRSLGDLTRKSDSNTTRDKVATKALMDWAGVTVPPGVYADPGQVSAVSKFVSASGARQFIGKPATGSLGVGLSVGLSPEEAVNYAQKSRVPFLIEEHISGEEYRVFAIQGSVVAAYRRTDACVVGDGRKSIEELINQKNLIRMRSPRASTLLVKKSSCAAYLRSRGISLKTVPVLGEKVLVSQKKGASHGSELVEVRDDLPIEVTQQALVALRATMLPSAGIDVIYSPVSKVAYVLEVNARAHIGSHSFPTIGSGNGNAIADALIDLYFPKTVRNPRHPEIRFSFAAIQNALSHASIAGVTLPTILSSHVKRRLVLQADKEIVEKLVNMLRPVTVWISHNEYSGNRFSINAFFSREALDHFKVLSHNKKLTIVSETVDPLIFY
jgi:cyanophycin synthetase